MENNIANNEIEQSQDVQKFGTFIGVYVPSVLTILGLIMYLRFGWVVGNLGLILTMVVVLLSSSITLITALSASSIATNMRIGVGGEYYMISRSLGIELGGAIGFPLFLCRTLSVTFYCFGLAEVIVTLWNAQAPSYYTQILAAVLIIFTIVLSGKSASLVLKLQVPILIAVGLSVLALIGGVLGGDMRSPEFTPAYRTTSEGFWYIFAVFFPAVTGFAAGIGLSGDLKDPRKSIPKGTILAVVTGAAVYLLIPVLMSVTNTISFDDLAVPSVESWTLVAIGGSLFIFPGIIGALISSAFGSALGAPRVLQSLAGDGLAPSFLGKLSPSGQPTIATYVSGAIALTAVMMGGLNTIARFVTILFLTLYVIINVSAAIENLVKDPSFRPTINVPWYISILGAIGGVWIMFLISPLSCLIAIALETSLYMYLRRLALKKAGGMSGPVYGLHSHDFH